MSKQHIALEIDGVRTLPLYSIIARTPPEGISAFGNAQCQLCYQEPQLDPSPFRCDPDSLALASRDWEFSMSAVKAWQKYAQGYLYFVQFRHDTTRVLTRSLNDHVELLSLICDLRLQLDPTPFGRTFRTLMSFGITQGEYRKDPEREQKYDEYAQTLDRIHDELCDHRDNADQLVARMLRLMTAKRLQWASLEPLDRRTSATDKPDQLRLFCSYSHKDELLRDQLEAHLSLLRREGAISTWHDRKITAGQEWKGQIDQNLASADIILLLVSADFINSDYCFDVELDSAIKRHENGACRVVPVILRDCDWTSAVFGKLQALPKDGKPVTSWPNADEAFTNIAKGLRTVTKEIKDQREPKDA